MEQHSTISTDHEVYHSTTQQFSPPHIHQVIPKHYPMEEEEKQIRY
jgi:hypothetical protein